MPIEFCPNCRNMLYGLDEDTIDGVKSAVLTCRKTECGYKKAVDPENPVVYEHSLREENTATLVMNPYLKYDPTLQHLTNVTCPNAECPTQTDKTLVPDVVAVEVDSTRLIWMYQCAHCNTTWTQSSRFVSK